MRGSAPLLALAVLLLSAVPASADECIGERCTIGRQKPKAPAPPNPGQSVRPVNGAVTNAPILIYVPTCPGNQPGTGELCDAATTECAEVTDFRYWVYVRTWDPATNAYGEPVRRAQPPFVCAGPEEVAEQDPRAAVLAQVRAQWQTFGLPGSQVVVEPVGDTLVGAKTRFSTSSPGTRSLPPRPIFGLGVTLRIEASGYRWDFGDGTQRDTAAGDPGVEHVYRESGPQQVTLRTFYTATFTVAGDPTVYPLEGTAEVPGPAEEVVAREARTQLEGG